MGLLQNRLVRSRVLRRFSILGRLADLVLVGGMAARFALRKGWLRDEQVERVGLAGVADGSPVGVGELVIGGAAALRLLRRRTRRTRR